MTTSTLFILNDAPYGNERPYNALRLAAALAGQDGQQVRVFLMADAVTCAKAGQRVPEGYYNVQLMLGKIIRKGEVGLCGTCMDARGLTEAEVVEGAQRSTLAQLTQWTAEAGKVLVFERCAVTDFLIANEPLIRLAAFAGVFVFMVLWEFVAPRRARVASRRVRWPSNLGLVALNTLLIRLLLPTTAVGVAMAMEAQGIGLLHLISPPTWLAFTLALVLLDLAIYLQHVLFHKLPWLWRLHRMHHADVDVDATNGLRFHPIEILLSMGIKFAVIALVGSPAAAVLVFEVLLNSLAIFNHSNVAMPVGLDRVLRLLLVTPDMHRIHHSWYARECNSNYGFNLTCWDRLLDTYCAEPQDGQLQMTLGLPDWREPVWLRLDQMLVQPFVDVPAQRGAG